MYHNKVTQTFSPPEHPFLVLTLISPLPLPSTTTHSPDLSTQHWLCFPVSSPLSTDDSTATHFSIFNLSFSIDEPDIVDGAIELLDDLVEAGKVDDEEDGVDSERGE